MAIKTTSVQDVFSIDLRSLALFRILLGAILLVDVINRISVVPAFYSDNGIVPRELVSLENIEHAYHLQLMMISGSEWFSVLFFALLGLLALLLLVGYKTRVVTVVVWLFFCSVVVRSPAINHAGDTLLICLLFWGMFLPLGRVFSLDSSFGESGIPDEKKYLSAATMGLLIQVALIYIITGMHKGWDESWLSGTHLYNTFSRFDYVEPAAFLIYPYYDLLTFLTHFTLILELFGPLLFFIPFAFVFFRAIGLILFSGLQIVIGLTMDVGLFPLISIAALVIFIPSQFWEHSSLAKIGSRIKSNFSKLFHSQRPSDNVAMIRPTMFNDLVCTLLLFYLISWNMGEISQFFRLPDVIKKPAYYLKLDQRWTMFVSPVGSARYYSVKTYSENNTTDLMCDLKVHYSSSDQFNHVGYTDYRWRIFFSNKIHLRNYQVYPPNLVDYMLKKKKYINESVERLKKVELVSHEYRIGKNYDHSPIRDNVVYSRSFEK